MDSIAKLKSRVDTYVLSDKPLIALSQTGSELVGISIWGTGATSDNYKAGILNYNLIDVQAGHFYDPLTKDDFKVAITTKLAERYSIAYGFESDEGPYGKVEGSWVPRTLKNIPGQWRSGSNTFRIGELGDMSYFFEGDFVSGTGIVDGTYISQKSPDGLTLFLSKNLSSDITEISLQQSDSLGLIQSIQNSTVPVTHFWKATPYIMQ